MSRKLLAVKPRSMNYLPSYEVTAARSFEQARDMIREAEEQGVPYDDLDLPVDDMEEFRAFVDWMEKNGRRYPFSIFGFRGADEFIRIRDEMRERGFHFNS